MSETTESVSLGATGLRVSALGAGTNTWGSRGSADPDKRQTLEALLAGGITLLDTAEIYTAGASERTVGRCVRQTGTSPVVLSKFFPFPWRWRKAALAAALRRSLDRLQLSRAEVYLLHFPLPPLSIEAWADALADAVEAGLARTVGVSNCGPAQVRRAHAALAARGVPLACNEVEYSLVERRPETSGLLEVCRDLDVTIIAYRPLALGTLTGKYSAEKPPTGLRGLAYGGRYLSRITPVLEATGRMAARRGKTRAQIALNWLLCKGAIPIPGAKDPAQARENAGALGWRLTTEEVSELDSLSREKV